MKLLLLLDRSLRTPVCSTLRWFLLCIGAVGAWSLCHAGDITITSSSSDYPNLSSVGPGDTIYLEGHTRSRLVLQSFSGSAANPVRIINTNGQFVINNGSNHGLIINNGTHFIIDGTGDSNYDYGIKIASTTAGAGLVVYGRSSHFEIHHLEIQNTDFAGMLIKSPNLTPADWLYDEISIHNNYIHNTEGEGIYVGSSFFNFGNEHYVNNCEIFDNIIVESGWDGIQLGSCTMGGSIHDNLIISWGLGVTSADGGYDQTRGIRWNPGSAGECYNNIIIGATVVGQGSYANGGGIYANPYDDTKFYNNVVVDSSTTGISMGANAGMIVGTQILIMNNTVVSPGTHGIEFDPTYASGSLAYNNIVANPVGNYFDLGGGASLTQSNNLMVSTVAAAGFVDAANDDYRLTSTSSAIDYGTNISSYGITDDLDGTSRPQGSAYDAGAFEYAPPPIGIVTPSAWGQATGSIPCPATGAFNEQPTWSGTAPTGSASNPYAWTLTSYQNAYWYIDFGPNYANIRITETWTRYGPWATSPQGGFATMWWDDDIDTTNDGITETTLSWGNATFTRDGVEKWLQNVDTNSSPVTPQARYLVIGTGTSPSNYANEFAIVGYTVN